MNDEDLDRQALAFGSLTAQFFDPVNCREIHPEQSTLDDPIECTLRRAHQQIERTPHRSANGVEWFAVSCRECSRQVVDSCPACRGSQRRLIDPADVEN